MTKELLSNEILNNIGLMEIQATDDYILRMEIEKIISVDNTLIINITSCYISILCSGWNKLSKYPTAISVIVTEGNIKFSTTDQSSAPMAFFFDDNGTVYLLYNKDEDRIKELTDDLVNQN